MTDNNDFKKLVRARMQKTGESYTTARMNLLSARTSSTKPGAAPEPDRADEGAAPKWPDFMERLLAEEAAELAHAVEFHGIRATREASGWWTATAPGYPGLERRAATRRDAERLVAEAIWEHRSGWRGQVDPETAAFLEMQDDD